MEAGGQEDNTLVWALDRLLDLDKEELSMTVLASLLPSVVGSAEDLPDVTRAKLCLRLLDAELAAGRMDEAVLSYLQKLAGCDVAAVANTAVVWPSPELILLVKTELGIQTWRDLKLPVEEAEVVLNRLFAGNNTQESYTRYDQLRAALRSPVLAAALNEQFPFQRSMGSATYFVHKALVAMPRSLLLAIQDDVQVGRYEIGVGAKRGAAALQDLGVGLADLEQQGGQDPLPEMLQHAAAAVAAAGGVPPGRHMRWTESPAVQHPMPEMEPARIQQHVPLAQPTPARQQGRQQGRRAAAVQGHEQEDQEGGKRRRPRLNWTAEEETELIDLVKLFGRGSWIEIRDKGAGVFDPLRTAVDLKDKCVLALYLRWQLMAPALACCLWRNLVKTNKIEPQTLQEVEMREAEICDNLRKQKRVGRPPKFVSPKPKRRRLGVPAVEDVDDDDDDDEEEEEEDPVEDADEGGEEDEAGDKETSAEDEDQQEARSQEEEEEEQKPQPRRSSRLQH
ncbi:expressed protein [Chlorella variabilis]|uniref:Expressed protein n=1 Tax=Chlorella variabilis TaxID=554065 RepID=E1ZKL1_CHLVA|nr:expressed protein [Chlorella variabilis]EFN53824.1 expressed protein [Chlorella variabilis]|eukprot:XP_005845926.1 expressed protein [Chlorella variabilis]